MNPFVKFMAEKRKALGMTREEFVLHLGLSPSPCSILFLEVEHNKSAARMHIRTLWKVSKALKVDTMWLFRLYLESFFGPLPEPPSPNRHLEGMIHNI